MLVAVQVTIRPRLDPGSLGMLVDWFVEPIGGMEDWASVPVRLALGIIFIYAGWGKWRRGIRGTAQWLKGLGFLYPFYVAIGIASLEFMGGLLLLLGLGTSWVAIPLAANMVGATFVQKFKLHAPFQGGDVQGYELDVLMVLALVGLIFLGSGPLSIDSLLK